MQKCQPLVALGIFRIRVDVDVWTKVGIWPGCLLKTRLDLDLCRLWLTGMQSQISERLPAALPLQHTIDVPPCKSPKSLQLQFRPGCTQVDTGQVQQPRFTCRQHSTGLPSACQSLIHRSALHGHLRACSTWCHVTSDVCLAATLRASRTVGTHTV